ncbi:M16 family metallopeptidase [Ohtaekwangia koreensis]|uniref:Zinc protease n=1 Tax=Ohtaekwangia koreensis TaxID=688867 RepID=A0A1T5M3P4_9BACT|nr:pitrilysin family protein [Ohtaekwangia koreensis]SKC82852.1 zinc protease [Ohtaekwangia koreensis]
MKKLLILALICAPMMLAAQAKLVEKIEKKGDQVIIPYEKYILPNGLTVIVHEDHSDPIVHVDVTYHVGSAREEIGKSGFAHFFEHMMFQGSDNVGDEQHFKIVTESGGTLNGTTNRDRTNYFETVPSNQLEKMLWLEADRMGFLLDAVTQKKFEIQRATVKNERGQNYDNRPYGLMGETIAKNLYPYGHPYSWLTIGYIEDLNRVSVDDLKNFFLRWYGPNNATVTVGGDVKAADVVKLAQKYFGSIPKGPDVQNMKLPAPVITSDRYVTLVDNYARLPQLVITYPTVPSYHPDEPALDCMVEILGQGKNSILYQQIVKDQKALNAAAFNSTTELAGECRLSLTPSPGVSLAESKKLLDNAIKTFETRGVTDEDIAKFKGSVQAQLIYSLQSVSGKVSQLAAYQTFTGSPNRIGKELDAYNKVTKEDVIRVYNTYIKGKAAVILSVVTKGNESNIAAPDNYTVNTSNYKAPDYGYSGLKYTKPSDAFDRTKLPGNGVNPVVKIPGFWRKDIDKIRVIGTESKELPIVTLSVTIPGGHLLMANDTSKIGLPRIFASMMNEDTQKYTAEQLQAELQKLGSSISVSSGLDGITVNVQSLTKNLDKTLALLEERILRPKFTPEAFARIQKQTVEGFKQRKSQPAIIASDVYTRLNYGSNNILGLSDIGTEYSVKNLTLKDVENYYTNYFTSTGVDVVIVGDVTQSTILGKLDFLKKLPAKDVKPALPSKAPAVEKTRIYIVDVPKAAQTEFRVGYVTGLKYDAIGEYYKAGLMNYALGGAFNSRVNLNLREDKGWTYGARSGFSGDKYTGEFVFSAGIKAAATDSALLEVINELTKYAKAGIQDSELSFMRSAIGQRDALRYETGFQKTSFIANILRYNLPGDFVDQQNKIVSTISKDELNILASKWIDTSKLNILLVGDKANILPGLKRLSYEIVELDVNGNKKGVIN